MINFTMFSYLFLYDIHGFLVVTGLQSNYTPICFYFLL